MCALKVGVVGAAGQVGLALLRGLNQETGITAVGICRNAVSAARVASQGLDVRAAQTEDPTCLAETLQDLDAVINCALPQYRPSKTSASNRRLAQSLTTACKGKHLIHFSSVAVYGNFISGDEHLFCSPKPDTSYGRQKLQMEKLLRKLAKRRSVQCTILRLGHVYGPELQWSESLFGLIRDNRFRLPFDGRRPSNAVAISNLIEAVKEVLLTKPAGSMFNLTNAPQISWRELFDAHSQACAGSYVGALGPSDSEILGQEHKEWARTGTMGRLIRETLRWMKQLPGSYLASVPALKAIAQQTVAMVGSDTIDARIWAIYCKKLAPRVEDGPARTIPPVFFSEPAPGPCVLYEGRGHSELESALRSWHGAISGQLDLRAEYWPGLSGKRP
ncbi:MAG: NAD(P)-dependent oxidoreductase [Terracidiphilus sp.]|jgi:nucleoside-diphosphate-sugar epimerase